MFPIQLTHTVFDNIASSNLNAVQATVALSLECTGQEVWFKLEEGLEGNLVGRIVIVWSEIREPLMFLPLFIPTLGQG